MDNINLMEYWLKSSDEDYNVMNFLYNGKKNSYSLFFGHLVIEKLLKGLYAKNDDYKESFNQKCTDEYTEIQIKNIEEVRTWLRSLLIAE